MDAVMMIAANDARSACKGETDILERIKKAMKETKNHYLLTGEVKQIQAACAGAILESNPVERERIEFSCRALVEMNNMLATGRIMPDGILEEISNRNDIIPLRKMWMEI